MSDQINRRDLDIILEVNRKSVELETEVAEQNEKIIETLDDILESFKKSDDNTSNYREKIVQKLSELSSQIKESSDIAVKKQESTEQLVNSKIKSVEEMISVIVKKTEESSKDIMSIKMLLASGFISLIIQIIQMFLKK